MLSVALANAPSSSPAWNSNTPNLCPRSTASRTIPNTPTSITRSMCCLISSRTWALDGAIGADSDGYPWIFGYRGQPLSQLTGSQVINCRAPIEDQMMVKSPAEIALLKESCKWGNLAHMLLQKYTEVGIGEVEVSQRASAEATLMMLEAIGPYLARQQPLVHRRYRRLSRADRPQRRHPPRLDQQHQIPKAGDVLVTGASAAVWAYVSELERTMILGAPTDDQKRYFEHMLNLQMIAMEALEPGQALQRRRPQSARLLRMHTTSCPAGSTIADIRSACATTKVPSSISAMTHEIKAGMVFTVEPGLYVPELGGFRHSDTVLVTDDGAEMLTYYPRDLESLTIPA